MKLSELTTRVAGTKDADFDVLMMRKALRLDDLKGAAKGAWDYAADNPQNVIAGAAPILGSALGATLAGKGRRGKGAMAGGLLGLSPAAILGIQMLQKALNKPGYPAEGPVDPNAAPPIRYPAEGPVDPNEAAAFPLDDPNRLLQYRGPTAGSDDLNPTAQDEFGRPPPEWIPPLQSEEEIGTGMDVSSVRARRQAEKVIQDILEGGGLDFDGYEEGGLEGRLDTIEPAALNALMGS